MAGNVLYFLHRHFRVAATLVLMMLGLGLGAVLGLLPGG
jgi:hypothetical protein